MRRRAGMGTELVSGVYLSMLRWFRDVERMDDYRMAIRVLTPLTSRFFSTVLPRAGVKHTTDER